MIFEVLCCEVQDIEGKTCEGTEMTISEVSSLK